MLNAVFPNTTVLQNFVAMALSMTMFNSAPSPGTRRKSQCTGDGFVCLSELLLPSVGRGMSCVLAARTAQVATLQLPAGGDFIPVVAARQTLKGYSPASVNVSNPATG